MALHAQGIFCLGLWVAGKTFYRAFGPLASGLATSFAAIVFSPPAIAFALVLIPVTLARPGAVARLLAPLAVVGVFAALGTGAWSAKEAHRALAGTPVLSSPFLGFSLYAQPAELVGDSATMAAAGVDRGTRLLYLGTHGGRSIFYDPRERRALAVPSRHAIFQLHPPG